jgi:hypothetical protein
VEARIERLEQQQAAAAAAMAAAAASSDNVGGRDVEERFMAIEERCEETTRRLAECAAGMETLKAATAVAAGGEAGEAATVEDGASGRGGGKNERRAGAWEALEVRVAAVAVDASEAAAQVRAFQSSLLCAMRSSSYVPPHRP